MQLNNVTNTAYFTAVTPKALSYTMNTLNNTTISTWKKEFLGEHISKYVFLNFKHNLLEEEGTAQLALL
jgi:hypothetical protein